MHSLSDTEQQALREALDDEYRAWATYDPVIPRWALSPIVPWSC
jgi:hypothetical protein